MIVEADRASRTVDDLLELSRIEFGDDAELVEVCRSARSSARRSAASHRRRSTPASRCRVAGRSGPVGCSATGASWSRRCSTCWTTP